MKTRAAAAPLSPRLLGPVRSGPGKCSGVFSCKAVRVGVLVRLRLRVRVRVRVRVGLTLQR